jgi:Superfamily II DNA and RNA helicases
VSYRLTGAWERFFSDVMSYARALVRSSEGQSLVQQRMRWWAALALLRCVSSSPAAASIALRTRIRAAEGGTDHEMIQVLDAEGIETVLDGESDDLLSLDEAVPAGQAETTVRGERPGMDASLMSEESAELRALIERAEGLKGRGQDPKLAGLLREIEGLLHEGFNPVVFCRYVATAHYLTEHLAHAFGDTTTVLCVTGELTPEEREQRVHGLAENDRRLLVTTDCLSEGVNLQSLLDAVIHYDLSWNPTRHEQREGRVDRFGQPKPVVRSLMYYGEDNPVDGAVFRVILQKAERIRKELGVAVPLPEDTNKVMQAVMEAVLLRGEAPLTRARQMSLDLEETEALVNQSWESARDKAVQSRTLFAQRSLHPEEVLPEWDKTINVLGGEEDIERFVRQAAERLSAPLEPEGVIYRLPYGFLPAELRERLAGVGFKPPVSSALRIAFRPPAPPGAEFIHRTHPLVAVLAEHLAELALSGKAAELIARCGAIFTQAVKTRTIVYLLRLRNQVVVRQREDTRHLLAEECLGVAVAGGAEPKLLSGREALELMSATPARNMEPMQRRRLIQTALDALGPLGPAFESIAKARAAELLADHRRVREASEARGSYEVIPGLPMDVIGVYVLNPVAVGRIFPRAMNKDKNNGFAALRVEGGIFPAEFLSKVATFEAKAQRPENYQLARGLNLRDEIGRAWRIAEAEWRAYRELCGRPDTDQTTVAQDWLACLLKQVLGFGIIEKTQAVELGERRFPLTHFARPGEIPLVLVPERYDLDRSAPEFGAEVKRRSPHGLM